jgi:hypothetical protein
MGAGRRPRLPEGAPRLLGRRVRLARARTRTEQVPPLPCRARRRPDPFRPRAGRRRTRGAPNPHPRLAQQLPGNAPNGPAPHGSGGTRHRGSLVRRRDPVAPGLRVLGTAIAARRHHALHRGALAPADARARVRALRGLRDGLGHVRRDVHGARGARGDDRGPPEQPRGPPRNRGPDRDRSPKRSAPTSTACGGGTKPSVGTA